MLSLKNNLQREFAILIRRKELHISVLICTLFAVASFIMGLSDNGNGFAEDALGAAHKASIFRSGLGQAFIVCILPLLTSFCYADSYYLERENGYSIPVRSRLSASRYLLDKAIVVFIASSLVVMLPFLINQGLCLIAYPIKSHSNIFNLSPYDNYLYLELENAHFPYLHMNNPYFNNLMHIFLVGVFGGNLAILALSISFFIKKNRILVLASTTIIVLFSYFILNMRNLRSYIAYYYLFADPVAGGLNIVHFFVVNLIILMISVILWVIYKKRDLV